MVVAAISIDGGRTFTNTVPVNDKGCSGGAQDMQAMAFDPTFDQTGESAILWIAWRHDRFDDPTSNSGLCIRGGRVDVPTQTISWLGAAEDVDNVDRAPFSGVGGVLVQAGLGSVTVMYQNSSTKQDCGDLVQMKWFTNTSFNNGVDWSASHQVYDTSSFNWCVFADTHANTPRAFGFVRDNNSRYWAAVHDAQNSIRVFFSEDIGFTWTEVHQEIATSTPSVLFPTLGADAGRRILLSYYASTANDLGVQRRAIAGEGQTDPTNWSLPVAVSATFPAPTPTTPGEPTRFLLDYDDIAAVDPMIYPSPGDGTFAVAWSDSSRAPMNAFAEVAMTYVNVAVP